MKQLLFVVHSTNRIENLLENGPLVIVSLALAAAGKAASLHSSRWGDTESECTQ